MTTRDQELDDLHLELNDYKAAVKYIHVLHTYQMKIYHYHLKKDHKDLRHTMAWERCLAVPCRYEREELAKVEAVMEHYKQPGDPRGSPDGDASTRLRRAQDNDSIRGQPDTQNT